MADSAERFRTLPPSARPEPEVGSQRHPALEGRATAAPSPSPARLERRPRPAGRGDSEPVLSGQAPKPQPIQQRAAPNRTGLPDKLKAGAEALAGISLDGTKVHFNSARPAQLNAAAYAQGRDIHLGPGQEKHLPHETWHVVQQAQGRVRATTQAKGGASVNDDSALEREADIMGAEALKVAPRELPGRMVDGARSRGVLQAHGYGDEGLARILVEGRVQGAGSASLLDGGIAQLNGKAEQLVADEMKEFFGHDGDFIWISGETSQSKKLSHVHLFKVEKDKITGQLTVRNRESDAGGPAFDSKTIEESVIIAEVLEKFGSDEPGAENRKAVVSGLTSLIDEVIEAWKSWKDQ